MSIQKRDDGVQFVVQAYRQALSSRQELSLLSNQQGSYVYLSKQNNNKWTAVFSEQPGYLLGESMWYFFGQPENLIFCEALPDSEYILLVVVRENQIYCDLKITGNRLRAELLPLIMDQRQYKVVVSGDVTLSDNLQYGKFTLPQELMSSFTRLDEPLFSRLPLLKSFQLQSLSNVLRSSHLNRVSRISKFALVGILLLLGGFWTLNSQEFKNTWLNRLGYYLANSDVSNTMNGLMTPSPLAQLNELATVVTHLYHVPGWQVTAIHFSHREYLIHFDHNKGKLATLAAWAKQNNYQYQLTKEGPKLLCHSNLHARAKSKLIYPIKTLLVFLMEQINRLLQVHDVKFEGMRQH